MKKLILALALIQGGFMIAQTKTVLTVNGEKVQVNPNAVNTADNGLNSTAGNVQLGGTLLKPTTITTTTNGTLSIGGLEAGSGTDNVLVAGPDGILKWVTRASFMQAGDNLGNHTATKDLQMSGKSIFDARSIYFVDSVASNEDEFTIYKNDGLISFWSTKVGTTLFTIDESTKKATANNLAISKGTDGLAPFAGYIATSLDANGNVVWKSPSSIVAGSQVQGDWNMAITSDPAYIKNKPTIPAPDNLGNHIATTDLNMSSKNITAANNITAIGTVTAANATVTTKTTTQTAAITKGVDNSTPVPGSIATALDGTGGIVWKSPSQADWNMATTTDPSYIKNKPTIPAALAAENGLKVGAITANTVGLGGTLGINTDVALNGKTLTFSGTTGNVGIGAAPNTAAKLDISATDKGLLIPRVALTATTSWAPLTGSATEGMMVYNTLNTITGANAAGKGFYTWDGYKWQPLSLNKNYDTGGGLIGVQVNSGTERFISNGYIADGQSFTIFIPDVYRIMKLNITTIKQNWDASIDEFLWSSNSSATRVAIQQTSSVCPTCALPLALKNAGGGVGAFNFPLSHGYYNFAFQMSDHNLIITNTSGSNLQVNVTFTDLR